MAVKLRLPKNLTIAKLAGTPLRRALLLLAVLAVAGGGVAIATVLAVPGDQAMVERAPVTLSLTAAGLFMAIFVGMTLGVAAAVRQNTITDQTAMTIALFGLSMPVQPRF